MLPLRRAASGSRLQSEKEHGGIAPGHHLAGSFETEDGPASGQGREHRYDTEGGAPSEAVTIASSRRRSARVTLTTIPALIMRA